MTDKKGRIFYGWWVLIGLFFSSFFGAWGRFILSVCGPAISRDTGWSISEIMLSVTVALLVYSISLIFAGQLIDKFGGKKVITSGSLCLIAGFAFLSTVTELWQLYLVHGVLLSAAVAMTHTVPTQAVGRKWFIKRAGLAGAILATSFSVSMAVVAPILSQSVASFGWRITSLICMCFGIIIILFATFIIRDTPEAIGLRPYGAGEKSSKKDSVSEAEVNIGQSEVLRTVSFWGLVFAFGFVGIPLQGLLANIVFWGDSVGLDPASAGLPLTVFSIPGIFSKPIWGWLGDSFGKRKVQIVGSILCALTMFIAWFWVNDAQSLYIVCFCYGLFYGNLVLLSPYIGDIFGRASVGTLVGYGVAAHGLLGAVGPFLWGKIFEVTGRYNPACLVSAGFYVLVVICYIVAKPLPRESTLDDHR